MAGRSSPVRGRLDYVVMYHLPSGLAGLEDAYTGAAAVKGTPLS